MYITANQIEQNYTYILRYKKETLFEVFYVIKNKYYIMLCNII